MSNPKEPSEKIDPLFEYVLRMADDRLIQGHRLSQWCGHAPIIEEDIAMANMALDYLGQATNLLGLISESNDDWNDADELAYWRDDIDYRNIKLVELPNGDFAFTMAREYLFSTFSYSFHKRLRLSRNDQLAGLASKAVKEDAYHMRHSRDWILRLGDGTDESHHRLQNAINEMWTYTGELFYMDEIDYGLIDEGIVFHMDEIKAEWAESVSATLELATLDLPDNNQFMAEGGRKGFHTEHLGYLLGEMQFLTRSYPDAAW